MMKNIYKKLVEKYFENQCTPEEAEKVLHWLDTVEGQTYLDEMIESELDLPMEDSGDFSSEGLDSKKLLSFILSHISRLGLLKTRRNSAYMTFFRIAAAVLVIVTATLLYRVNEQVEPPPQEVVNTYFSTDSNEQKQFRLADGTSIRLNSNSELTVSADFLHGSREVSLKGEAFFEVIHQSDNPFTVHTDVAEVEVLGTSFNVKSDEGNRRAEISVVEGKVALYRNGGNVNRGIILEKDEYAYWDDKGKELKREHFGAQNYLAWMTNQLVFEDLPLSKVCIQLDRFYGLRCQFNSTHIKEMALNANIPDPNLQNTLSVIALSLELDYHQEDGRIIWIDSESLE